MKMNLRFKLARISKQFTQKELGALVGLPEYRITAIETGRWAPDADVKRRIAKVLDQATFEIFDR